MTFDVTVNGYPWRVAIEPADRVGCVQVSVNGRRCVFDAAWIDPDTLSLIDVDEAALVREAGIRSTRGGELDVVVAGRRFRALVAVKGRSAPSARGHRASAVAEGRLAVVSPMPGRIVRVMVAPGDRVTAGQGVVVVEAMKMENELRSPKDGVVRDVNVNEGAAIDAGALLVVIE